jgi:signal transduction histidine kinase
MRNFDWAIFISLFYAGIYLLFVFSARRQEIVNRITHGVMLYAILSAFWEVLWAIYRWGLFDFTKIDLGIWLVSFGIIILALVFLICTMLFLQVKSGFWAWVGISAGFAVVLCALLVSIFPLPENLRIVIFVLLVMGWLAVIGTGGYITQKSFRQAKKPHYKNRVGYWGLSLAATILGDIILFTGVFKGFYITSATEFPAGFWMIGSILHMAGALTAGYVVLIHDAINLVWGFLRLLSYVAVTLVGVFLIVFVLGLDLTGLSLMESKTIEWIIKAIVLVVLVVPGLGWLYGYFNKIILGPGLDRNTAVREYGLSISNLVDLDKLAEVALGFLEKTLGVEFSYLFIVDDRKQEDYFQLLPIINPVKHSLENVAAGKIPRNSIFTRHFLKEQRMLFQYDLDYLPKFQNNCPEKEWLSSLQGELYVPILTKESWIGLFVLGPKKIGNQFFGDEIGLLSTLANQTVAALQNARLFSDLRRLNADLRQTYQALEEANRQLRDMDEMKTAFIGVITHEMRTPLANMGFSLQVLERNGIQNLLPGQREQLDQISDGIKSTRSMIDDLITLAALLNKQVDLILERLDFQEILDWAADTYMEKAKEKQLIYKVDKIGDVILIGDRKLLTIAVNQLIENAIKFSNNGGSVWVSCWTTTEALWLDVRDTGQGISKEKLDKVWQSFTQVKADSIRRGVEGLGLGLSLVKLIVIAHGGQVFVESEVNSGSVFGFRIPLKGPDYPLNTVPIDPTHNEILGLPI